MKFARYLEETQTPEWKKAYIDYRGLKKRITAIRRAHQAAAPGGEDDCAPLVRSSVSSDSEAHRRPDSRHSVLVASPIAATSSRPLPFSDSEAVDAEEPSGYHSDPWPGEPHDSEPHDSPAAGPSGEHHVPPRARRRSTTVTGILGRAFSTSNHPFHGSSHKGSGPHQQGGPRFDLRQPIPLMELLPQLTPVERAFFEKLDQELDKVESFYCEREREMRHRGHLLKEQLQELQDHRRAFYEAHPVAAAPYSWLPLPLSAPIIPNILVRRRKARQGRQPHQNSENSRKSSPSNDRSDGFEEARVVGGTDGVVEPEIAKSRVREFESTNGDHDDTKDGGSSPENTIGRSRWRNSGAGKGVHALFQLRPSPISGGDSKGKGIDEVSNESGYPPRHHGNGSRVGMRYDPEEYQHAKKQLKKAVLECYRGLELLNNYRTLNLIGFRKALKKFEKVTHVRMPIHQGMTTLTAL
ncbi:SPX domain-containing protein [Trametes elegans]|nr:SPX domain-containing protein [Trametes elegans]